MAPLMQLPQLQRLCLANHTSMVQRAVIKQLGSLASLDSTFDGSKRDESLWLLQPAHALQRLQELPLSADTVDPQLLELLGQLPTLTALPAVSIEPDCWAGLGGLSQLRTLQVSRPGDFTPLQQ